MPEWYAPYWHAAQDEPQFLLERRDPDAPFRRGVSAAGTLLFHVAAIVLALFVPGGGAAIPDSPRVEADLRRATPLVAPRLDQFRLTQKEPQLSKPSLEVDLAGLMPKPEVVRAPRVTPRGFIPPAGAPREAQAAMEAPQVEMAQQGALTGLPPAPVPQLAGAPPPPDRAKSPFESVQGPQSQAARQAAMPAKPQIEVPKSGVEEAVRSVTRGAGGRGQIVGDVGVPDGGVVEGLAQQATPGRSASTLELLSDPQGMDFRPYLIQVLASVKRNWQAVMPESVRLGQRRGRVAVQFIIDKSGRVPKLVIAMPSGADPLDRAAVAGISASNPFPPLPAEFRGSEIRLQLVFSYNMPR